MTRQFFAPIGSGLGDVIVSLPILRALIARNKPTFLIANSERQLGLESCLTGIAGTFSRPDFEAMRKEPDDIVYDFRAHPLQTDHVWGSRAFAEQFPATRINDILGTICRELSIDADLDRLIPIPHRANRELNGQIALIPGTVSNAKSWPLDCWFQLCHHLSNTANNVVLLGQPERNSIVAQLIDGGIFWVETPQIMDAISIISSAKLVIAVDTGLMHIAVNQGVRTVVLYERNPIYYRPAPHCLPLFAGECVADCLQQTEEFSLRRDVSELWAWYNGDFVKCKAAENQRCMAAISVEDVLSKTMQPITSYLD